MSTTKLGSGSYGTVYLAPGGDDAVKFFVEDNCMTFIREVNIMQCVRGHPLFTQLVNVLPSSRVEELHGVPFMPRQTKEGKTQTLSDMCIVMKCVKKAPSTSAQDMPFVLLDLLLACEFLESRNIVHRDMSINNVIITFDPNLKRNKAVIADFGTAVFSNHNPERNVTTPGFLPPEMSKDTQFIVVNNTYDLFSAACVVFMLIANRTFHRSATWKTCQTASDINKHRDERLGLIEDDFIRQVLSECLGHFASRSSARELINKYFLTQSKYQCHIRVIRKLLKAEPSHLELVDSAVSPDWTIKRQNERLRQAFNAFPRKVAHTEENLTLALKFITGLMTRHHTTDNIANFIAQHGAVISSALLRRLVQSVAESVNFMISM